MTWSLPHGRQRLGEPPPRRVAVLRALQLGDLLCAVPAFRALRHALPEAEITLVGLPWASAFVARFHRYLDHFLALPGWPGLPEQPPQPGRVPAFLAAAQAQRFDLAIQLHGSGAVSNPLTVLLDARRTAGFYRPGEYCPDPEWFLVYPEDEHEVRRWLRLLAFLGVPPQGEALEFPLVAEDRRELAQLPGAERLEPGGYVCVHPGARAPARRWPAERFAAVADGLAAQGLAVVLTGSAAERHLTRAVAAAMHAPALDLAGQTSLGALGALLAGARLVVCNDTGVSHLAAALRVPSVVVFTASDPARWAPLDPTRHRALSHPCGLGLEPAAVLRAAQELLQVSG